MSQIGFRGWRIDHAGALIALNREAYPPIEALEAECSNYESAVRAERARRPDSIIKPQAVEEIRVSIGGGRWKVHGGVPSMDCSCGIYLFKWGEDLEGLYRSSGYSSIKVFGVCEWWGDYVEHELGWRVQYAIPRALHVVAGTLHPVYHHLIDPNVKTWEQLLERWEPDSKPGKREDA